MTLNEALTQGRIPQGFDLLVVDVEGHENDVFAGFDIKTWQPRMMIVELTDTHDAIHSLKRKHGELYQDLLRGDYVPVYKDAINTVLARQDVYLRGLMGSSK